MDACQLIRERLAALGLDQKGLAAAAEVTESYVSQLLTRRKLPPAPSRTDIYQKMEGFLKLPPGKLAELAELQRTEDLRRTLGGAPRALNEGVRGFVLRKCIPSREPEIRTEFEKDTFGPLERLVTQKLFDAAKSVAREELGSENGIHLLARISGRTFEETRVTVLEFLDLDLFAPSAGNWISFLDPLIESWEIDLGTFGMVIVMNRRLGPRHRRRLELAEAESGEPREDERGLKEFLGDAALSGDVNDAEVAFLKRLRFDGRRPTALYYYRELQNLRDPLHFRDGD
jgi:transcriptional regulator with XRE-family HTH domain